jgi:Flp pilus assembly protein TadD
LPPVAPPDANPREEAARQIARGKEAFAAGEHGLAAHRFRQATLIAPAEPLGHLLLGESFFALGKYGEAVEAIVNGVRLQPDWPTRRFRPLDLYGDNLVEYPDHLGRLEDALRRTPDDPALLFLYGYQLWFDGRQEEAVPLFRKALPGFGDKAVIERFLQVPRAGAPLL